MKVWKIGHSETNNEWVQVKGGNFPFIVDVLNDTPRKSGWTQLELIGVNGTHSPLRFDSPWFSGRSLIVTDHAKRCLEELLDENTELLPARLEGESLWLIHVMSAENCVNQRESVMSRTTSGEVRGFFEYQFNEGAVEPLTLFGIPEEMVCHPLCTDSFKNRVEECGLTGLEFKLVWDSELPVGSIVFKSVCV